MKKKCMFIYKDIEKVPVKKGWTFLNKVDFFSPLTEFCFPFFFNITKPVSHVYINLTWRATRVDVFLYKFDVASYSRRCLSI